MPPIQRLVSCPKEDSDVDLEDCQNCEYYEGEDILEVECSYEDEKNETKEK
jgi:hypothetical protein